MDQCEKEGRRQICFWGKQLYDKDLVVACDGNLSVRLSEDRILCTPTGISKGFMTEDMLVVLDQWGNQVSGERNPSSEAPMHVKLYQSNPTIKGIVHAHPPAATAFAIAGMPVEPDLSIEAALSLGYIPVVSYATPGTEEMAHKVAAFGKAYKGALLASHGAVTWGKDLVEAFHRMTMLEHYAKMTLYSRYIIGQAQSIQEEEVKRLKGDK